MKKIIKLIALSALMFASLSLAAANSDTTQYPLEFLKPHNESSLSFHDIGACIQRCRVDLAACLDNPPSGPLGTEICRIRWEVCTNRCPAEGQPGGGF